MEKDMVYSISIKKRICFSQELNKVKNQPAPSLLGLASLFLKERTKENSRPTTTTRQLQKNLGG
jgi:hypothetical protein